MPCPRFLMPRQLPRPFLLCSCDSLECRGCMPQRLPVASPYDKVRTTVADRRTDAEPSSLVPNIRMRMPAAAPVIQPRISHPISRISSLVAAILAVFLRTTKESARPFPYATIVFPIVPKPAPHGSSHLPHHDSPTNLHPARPTVPLTGTAATSETDRWGGDPVFSTMESSTVAFTGTSATSESDRREERRAFPTMESPTVPLTGTAATSKTHR